MNKLTKTITFGATAAAIFTLMYAVFGINDSFVQEGVTVVALVPLAAYTYLYGLRAGLLSGLSALALSAFLVQPYVFVINSVPCAIAGVTLGILAKRAKPLVTFGIVSGILFLQLFYEIAAARLFFQMDVIAEYTEFINRITGFFADGSVFSTFAHDAALCSIPVVFALSAMAKTVMYGFILFILLNRVFKENIRLTLRVPDIKSKLLAWIFLCTEILCAGYVTLTLTGIIGYSFASAVAAVAELAIMYIYLIPALRIINISRYKLSFINRMLLSFVLILLFPVTDNYFAISTLLGKK